jgi:hypothetical protein
MFFYIEREGGGLKRSKTVIAKEARLKQSIVN